MSSTFVYFIKEVFELAMQGPCVWLVCPSVAVALHLNKAQCALNEAASCHEHEIHDARFCKKLLAQTIA